MLQSIARASSYLTEYEQLREVLAPQPGETLLGAARRLVAERDAARAQPSAATTAIELASPVVGPTAIAPADDLEQSRKPPQQRVHSISIFVGESDPDHDYAMLRVQRGPWRVPEDNPVFEFYWLSGPDIHSRSSDSDWRRVARFPPHPDAWEAVAAAASALQQHDARGYLRALVAQHDALDALLSEAALVPGEGFRYLGGLPARVVWHDYAFTYQKRGHHEPREGYHEDYPGRSNCFIVFDVQRRQWAACWQGDVTYGDTLEDAAGPDFAPIPI